MKQNASENGKDGLLEVGSRHYLEAKAAMAMFRQEVYERCRLPLKRQCQVLAKASGVKLDPGKIKLHDWPGLDDPEVGYWAVLGARLSTTDVAFQCYLWWPYEPAEGSEIRAVVALAFVSAAVRDRLFDMLQKVSPKVKLDNESNEVYLDESSRSAEAAVATLDGLILEWSSLLEKIGGLRLQ